MQVIFCLCERRVCSITNAQSFYISAQRYRKRREIPTFSENLSIFFVQKAIFLPETAFLLTQNRTFIIAVFVGSYVAYDIFLFERSQ